MKQLLQLSDIHKSYGNKQVLSGIDFSLAGGDILGYIGPNGAGKTTTMKIICNLCKADSGSVLIGDGTEGVRLGVVFDYNGLYPNLTARENLQFFWKLYNRSDKEKRLDHFLDLVGLSDVMDQRVKFFSKGMARRLVLARTLIHEPNLLLMDEPFDGLDVESQYLMTRFLKQWVKEENHGILFTSHNMKEIQEFCSRIILLRNGSISMQGTVEELLQAHFRGIRIHISHAEDVERTCDVLSGFYQSFEKNGDQICFYMDKESREAMIQAFIVSQIPFREIVEVTDTLEEIYIGEVEKNE